MALNLPVQTATVPANFCFSGFNSPSWLDIVNLLSVDFPDDVAPVNFGSDTPAPDRRDRPWVRTNNDGSPDRLYVYWNGTWVSRHAMPPGAVIMYEGTQSSIPTFDGGENTPVTAIGGPFWEEVTQMQARSPIGPGVLPSGATINVGNQGGEEKHVLVTAEMPKHLHTVVTRKIDGIEIIGSSEIRVEAFEAYTNGTDTPLPSPLYASKNTSEVGSDTAHNNMSPWYGIFAIRRTARLFYRV